MKETSEATMPHLSDFYATVEQPMLFPEKRWKKRVAGLMTPEYAYAIDNLLPMLVHGTNAFDTSGLTPSQWLSLRPKYRTGYGRNRVDGLRKHGDHVLYLESSNLQPYADETIREVAAHPDRLGLWQYAARLHQLAHDESASPQVDAQNIRCNFGYVDATTSYGVDISMKPLDVEGYGTVAIYESDEDPLMMMPVGDVRDMCRGYTIMEHHMRRLKHGQEEKAGMGLVRLATGDTDNDPTPSFDHAWGVIHEPGHGNSDDDWREWKKAGPFPGLDHISPIQASRMIDVLRSEQQAIHAADKSAKNEQGDRQEFSKGERVHNDWLGQEGTILSTTTKTATVRFDHEARPRRVMKHNLRPLHPKEPPSAPTLETGDRITTPTRGPGTVTGMDGRFATILLDDGTTGRFMASYLKKEQS